MVTIVVEGPQHAGKGYVIATIAHALREIGCDVTVQLEETHNHRKMIKSEDEIKTRLVGEKVTIQELQTAK